MTDTNADDADGQNSKLSRRTALALMGTSAVGGAAATGAFSTLTADRPINLGVDNSTADVSVAADDANDELEITAGDTFDAVVTPNDPAGFIANNGAGTVSSEDPVTVSLSGGNVAELQYAHLSESGGTAAELEVDAYANTSGLDINAKQSVTLPLDTNAVHRYTFDSAETTDSDSDGTDDTLTDYWGSNDASFNGGPTTGASGLSGLGEAYDFDGSDDYLSLASDPSSTEEATVAVWVNLDSAAIGDSSYGGILSCDDWTPGRIHFHLNQSDNFGATQNNGGRLESSISVSSDTWYHVAYTIDNNNSIAKLYIDGSEEASASTTTTVNLSNIVLGRGYGGRYLDGSLADARYYGRALSGAEISALYNEGSV